MDSNTELITAIAHQVEAYLKQAVQQRVVAGEPVTLATLETELRECLRQTGAQALSEFLSTALGTPVATVPCECGESLHYQRRRPAVVLSVFGRVEYTRAYYAGCPCGHGKAPLDEHYGIEPGQVSAGLAKLLSLAGVELPFEHSAVVEGVLVIRRVGEYGAARNPGCTASLTRGKCGLNRAIRLKRLKNRGRRKRGGI